MSTARQGEEAPAVSVVIPAYNAAGFIASALESVFEQTFSDFEVIVVDDGSTDGTARVVEEFGAPVRLVRKENGGTASARNRGIREASGRYVAFLDADNLWLPEKLEAQMQLFEARPALAWSYADSLVVDAATGAVLRRKGRQSGLPEGWVLRRLLFGNPIPPSTVVVRRDVLGEVGPFDASPLHRISEGWELWTRIAARYPAGCVPRPLVKTRQHARRKTSTMDLGEALRSRRAIVEKAVRRDPDRLARARGRALACLFVNIGRKHLEREERAEARRLFRKALRHRACNLQAWLYWLAAFVPRRGLRMLGRLRQRFWLDPSFETSS